MVKPKYDKPRGILHAPTAEPGIGHWRYWPTSDLADFVEHYWTVEWSLTTPLLRETLPHPSVHIVFEDGQAQIAGAWTRRFTRTLAGTGRAFAIKFRPGGFRPFVAQPVCMFTDRIVALHDVFGSEALKLASGVDAAIDHATAIEAIESFLRSRHPQQHPNVRRVGLIAERIACDRDISRIEQVAREFGLGARALQRLFREFVGVSPKWVIQRYRLHELVERLAAAAPLDWAETALALGYADQAHLIRDFKKLVGCTPAGYANAIARNTSAVSG